MHSELLISQEYWGLIVIVFFGGVITVSLLIKIGLILFTDKKTEIHDNKVLGGLGVLMVAIVANNAWIYFLSFFIAGLLIASERFMLLLAAVFNSDRTNVHKIPSYWNANQTAIDEQDIVEAIDETTTTEITDETNKKEGSKIKKSAKQSNEALHPKPKIESKNASGETLLNYMNQLRQIEDKALRNLESRIGWSQMLKRGVVVKVGERTINYDAILVETETNRIVGAFEVKYFLKMRSMNVKAFLNNRARQYLSSDFKVCFVFVFGDYSHAEMNLILQVVEEFERSTENAIVAVYQDDGKYSLQALYESSIKKAFPGRSPLFS